MIPRCFNQPSTPRESVSNQVPQNLITSVYQAQIFCSSIHLTITWAMNHFYHTLTLYSDFFCVTIPLQSASFSLCRKRGHGSKSIYLPHHCPHQRFKLHWDFSNAEFAPHSAEPERDFYLAISCNLKLEFFLGDLLDELTRRSGIQLTNGRTNEPNLLSRREHVFGHSSYVSTARFPGSRHQIVIECVRGSLIVQVDGLTSLVVKRLAWKFRGHERIVVGGTEVDFYWDVFNWVNENIIGDNHSGRTNGVFIFQVGDHVGVCPEIIGPEKRLLKKNLSSASTTPASSSPSSSSVLQWAEESSECGRSSCSSSTTRSSGSGGGFSLLLYAWRKDEGIEIVSTQ